MFTVNIQSPWHVSPPILFRFMDAQYVKAFFEHGKLRLSSFRQFTQHADEQRLDVEEGEVSLLIQPPSGEQGHAMYAAIRVAASAYALSTTLRNDDWIAEAFGSRAYIKINNPTAFGIAIARRIPGFRLGVEGPCRYQVNRVVYKPLPGITAGDFRDESGAVDLRKISQFFQEHVESYPYFLKHTRFAPQSEYRFIWECEGECADFLDLVVPEAIQYCEPPSEFHK